MMHARSTSVVRRAALALGCAALLALPARATWSVVAIDRATGEICIAGATCGAGDYLAGSIAVVVPGHGVAAAQALGKSEIVNRRVIWDGLLADRTPQEILDELANTDGAHGRRQYGIVSTVGDPVSYTGHSVGRARISVRGQVGTIVYAIQGNVLAARKVVRKAEITFLQSQRDLGQRVMDAMETARRYGGDGRCSCSQNEPDGCGSPPPGFEKSAHSAFVIISRLGDEMGVCGPPTGLGCAGGDYYLNLTVPSANPLPDPVVRLRRAYKLWREDMRGVPDHLETRVEPAATRLVADGVTETLVTVRLVDLHGDPLSRGGQAIDVTAVGAGAPVALPGPVVDNGDGTHTFTLRATTNAGTGAWRLVVTDAGETIQLSPDLVVDVDPLAPLHLGRDQLDASAAPALPLVINVPGAPGASYNLLGSAAGTDPGITIGGQSVPLNRDRLFQFTYLATMSPLFPGSAGVLDATGRAQASLELPPAAWEVLVGREVHFVALIPSAVPPVTNLVSCEVVP